MVAGEASRAPEKLGGAPEGHPGEEAGTGVLFLLEVDGRQVGYYESREAAEEVGTALVRILEIPEVL